MTPKQITQYTIFNGKGIEMPPSAYGTFKQAEKVKKKDDATQLTMGKE
jgi:hypothetical protein